MFKYIYSRLFRKIRGVAIKNSMVHRTSKVESGTSFINSEMGKYSFCGYDCDINHTIIGAFCSIANGVIIGGGMHPIHWVSTSPVFYRGRDSVRKKFEEFEREDIKETRIGNDVWIGQAVIIKQGVSIGDGAVIGMGSIVTKDVEPYSIFAGNPAKKLRMRFEPKIVEGLLETRWWALSDDELEEASSFIKDPEKFIAELKKVRNIELR